MGVKELLQPQLRKFVIFFFTLTGAYYMYSWGFIRPAIATSFGFFAKEQAVILSILTLVGAVAIRLAPKFRRYVSDYAGLVILSIVMGISFLIAAFSIGYYGFLAMLTIALAGKFAYPWLSIVVNKRIPSKYRATTLSTAALINRIPYVVIAITPGSLIEQGRLSTFNIGTGITILLGILLSYFISVLNNYRLTRTRII